MKFEYFMLPVILKELKKSQSAFLISVKFLQIPAKRVSKILQIGTKPEKVTI
jgi:hypothetical protein